MIVRPQIVLDPRNAEQMVRQIIARRLGYVPELDIGESGPGRALTEVAARYAQAIVQRLNRAPDKNKLVFLSLLGLSLVPAQAARAPVVFELSEQSGDSSVPANTQMAAPPPPESSGQIVFETERATGLAAGRLVQVVSLWPGRDQYIDHSDEFKAGLPFHLFEKLKLDDTPHAIYIAHDTLLALSGQTHVAVEFELSRLGSAPLAIVWEYWDGEVWRPFKGMKPACRGIEEEVEDGTNGLARSGTIHLKTDCAETAKTVVNPASFRITEQTLESLKADGVPENVLEELGKLEGQRIQGEHRFMDAVEGRIGSTARSTYESSILKLTEQGIEAYWIRGSLSQTLPPDPATILPEVDQIRLSTIIEQPLKISFKTDAEEKDLSGRGETVSVLVVNEAGYPVKGVPAAIRGPEGSSATVASGATDAAGEFEQLTAPEGAYEAEIVFYEEPKANEADYTDGTKVLQFTFTVGVEGLDPDQAFADATKLDVTKPFYPFGQQPQPGSTFYFTNEEVFSKPGATLQIYMARAASPQDSLKTKASTTDIEGGESMSDTGTSLSHVVSWEYWNGREWVILRQSMPDSADLDRTEILELTVPTDMAATKVNDQEALWMRVRLVSGGFGSVNEVTWTDPIDRKTTNTFTYVVTQPPSLAAFRLGYTWQHGPYAPEQVWTYNDFQYKERTYEATWPGKTFAPFAQIEDITPALYLGFDKKLPVDRLSLFFDITEVRGDTKGEEMVWEYWNGASWSELFVEDETQRLRVPGMLSFIGAQDSEEYARFDAELHWLRGRLKEDAPPGEPECLGIFPNAVWISQRQTFTNATLGVRTGQPTQRFKFPQIPVLEGARLEVQELSGARANVEWRILARQIAPENPRLVAELEELLAREGSQSEVELGDIRLRRDRSKRVTEVWVRWYEQPHLFSSTPEDRHFTIDRASGRIQFGDGTLGKALPLGATVLARQYCAGGGKAGNVAAGAISQLLGGVAGVQGVSNPVAAEGGADGETLERFRERGPATVRHRGRAISPLDYETLAREASPAVAVARAVPTRNATGQALPGWVTVILIPESQEARPWPSFGLREQVRRFIEQRAPCEIAAAHRVYVTGPDYQPVDVAATIAPLNDATDVGSVEEAAREALETFLHPLQGGPERRGWAPGRHVFLSDVATVLEEVAGVNYVEELTLLLEGNPQGTMVRVAEDRVVVAGELRLKFKASEG